MPIDNSGGSGIGSPHARSSSRYASCQFLASFSGCTQDQSHPGDRQHNLMILTTLRVSSLINTEHSFLFVVINGKVSTTAMNKISQLRPRKETSPSIVNGKVSRKPYRDIRSREYLTADEIQALMHAAGEIGRHGHRDKTIILTAYRHAL